MSRGARPGREGLSETSGEDVPWGRPAVDGIPLPPFRDAAAHRSYVLSLQTFIALLDEGEPAPTTVALLAALAAEMPRNDAEVPALLSPLALGVSLSTFFPAPWTPKALAEPRRARSVHPERGRGKLGVGRRSRLSGDHPPRRMVDRAARARLRTRATLAHEGDLVLLWMDMFRNRFPYPIAHMPSTLAESPAALAVAARATRGAHAANTAMPYLQNWRAERDRALTGGPEEHGPLR